MPVYWAGFRSTTRELQHHGWEFAVEEFAPYDRIRFMLRHDRGGFTGYAEVERRYVYESADRQYRNDDALRQPIEIQWVRMDHQVKFIRIERPVLRSFTRVDMEPDHFGSREYGSVASSGLFRPWSENGQELIVEPASVLQLLEQIKSMQSPELAAARARNRARPPRGHHEALDSSRELVHAKIITLEAA
jgi:hypothetical protein